MTAIRNIRAVTAKELYCYFASPVAYVFFIIFLMLMGFFTFMWGNFFEQGEATLSSFFIWHYSLSTCLKEPLNIFDFLRTSSWEKSLHNFLRQPMLNLSSVYFACFV